jgi:transposase-like protein
MARAVSLPESIDQRTIELIASRVVEALREELAVIAAQLAAHDDPESALTVGDVAERFGVARSTVYAHWQEWGGFKLGESPTAPIRFQGADLPTRPEKQPAEEPVPSRPARRRPRRQLISGAPRLELRPEDLR